MSRRAVVLVLAAVIAVAVAIPALADSGTTATTASVKGLSKRALGKAKAALRTARAAKRRARRVAFAAAAAERSATGAWDAASAAQGSAATAKASAGAASSSAAEAQRRAASADVKADGAERTAREARAEVASTRPQVGVEPGTVSTASEAFVALGGPAVTVAVSGSGLVQVWAQASVGDGGAVSLYEDGQPVAGQADCFGEAGPPAEQAGVLFASPGGSEGGEEPLLVGTPAALPYCSTLGPPAAVLFEASPGTHTFELRYAACGCSGTATFSQRRLVVAPLP